METGRLPHHGTVNDAVYYVYVMSRFALRTVAHVKLYIGLFQPRRSEELSALTVDSCRYASVRVTNSNKCDTEYEDKKCKENNKGIQTKSSNYVEGSILYIKRPFCICMSSIETEGHLMIETYKRKSHS